MKALPPIIAGLVAVVIGLLIFGAIRSHGEQAEEVEAAATTT